MTTLAIHQPGYLPWLGFFDEMRRVDVFVYYDDVAFDKNGWRNRNRIKGPYGEHWLTVPVRHSGRHGQLIRDVVIDGRGNWARDHVETIRQFYAKAPYLDDYLPGLEEMLHRPWELLIDLNLAVTGLMCGWLGLTTKVCLSSETGIEGGKSERLLNICRHFQADTYLSANASKSYLQQDIFTQSGIEVVWQNYQCRPYAQQHGDFLSYLSALDLILNVGPGSLEFISLGADQKFHD